MGNTDSIVRGYRVAVRDLGVLHAITSVRRTQDKRYEAECFVWGEDHYRSERIKHAYTGNAGAALKSIEKETRRQAQSLVDEIVSDYPTATRFRNRLKRMEIMACVPHTCASVKFAEHLQKIRKQTRNQEVRDVVARVLNAANLFHVMTDWEMLNHSES